MKVKKKNQYDLCAELSFLTPFQSLGQRHLREYSWTSWIQLVQVDKGVAAVIKIAQ